MKPSAMHPAAERELDEVIDYYAAIDPDLSDAFVDCFESCRDQMTGHPLHFSRRKGVLRRANLTPQFGEYYLPFMIWKDRSSSPSLMPNAAHITGGSALGNRRRCFDCDSQKVSNILSDFNPKKMQEW